MPVQGAGWPVLVRWQLKRPMYDFKNSFPLLLYAFKEQNIFFPETCFAYLISELKFTVCRVIHKWRHPRKGPVWECRVFSNIKWFLRPNFGEKCRKSSWEGSIGWKNRVTSFFGSSLQKNNMVEPLPLLPSPTISPFSISRIHMKFKFRFYILIYSTVPLLEISNDRCKIWPLVGKVIQKSSIRVRDFNWRVQNLAVSRKN